MYTNLFTFTFRLLAHSKMARLENKVAFVTGSSKGIGRAIAIELLKNRSHVILNGRNEKCLEATAKDLSNNGEPLLALQGDVSDSQVFRTMIEKIIERYGRLDILILNAGVSTYGIIEDVEDKALQSVMSINTLACYSCAHVAVPYLKQSKGSLVFISSLAGLHGLPRTSLYCMSKMALTGLAQSLRLDLRKSNVHIGIIYVGFTRNDPDKTIVDCQGEIKPIIPRPNWITQSKQKVARAILRNIKRRRFKSILSPMGRIMNYLFRHFPRFSMFLVQLSSKSSEKLTVAEER